ncbi:T9SS type A sorting domain-containing protein, partial [Dokdonia ponticola]
ILDGQVDWTSDFDFDVDANTPEKDVVFTLEVTSDEGSWILTFIVHIYAGGGNCDIAYADQLVKDGTGGGVGNDDGQANPGEEIDLEVALEAIGCDLHNVSGILSTNDSDITITDDSQSWGDILEGQVDWTSDFDFDVDANTPEKDVVFTLEVTSDEGSWVLTFIVHVYEEALDVRDFNLNNSVTLFPNPASNVFYINSSMSSRLEVRVLDLLGRQVMPTRTIDANTRIEFNPIGLSDSIYLVKISDPLSDGFITKKLMISH